MVIENHRHKFRCSIPSVITEHEHVLRIILIDMRHSIVNHKLNSSIILITNGRSIKWKSLWNIRIIIDRQPVLHAYHITVFYKNNCGFLFVLKYHFEGTFSPSLNIRKVTEIASLHPYRKAYKVILKQEVDGFLTEIM